MILSLQIHIDINITEVIHVIIYGKKRYVNFHFKQKSQKLIFEVTSIIFKREKNKNYFLKNHAEIRQQIEKQKLNHANYIGETIYIRLKEYKY